MSGISIKIIIISKGTFHVKSKHFEAFRAIRELYKLSILIVLIIINVIIITLNKVRETQVRDHVAFQVELLEIPEKFF